MSIHRHTLGICLASALLMCVAGCNGSPSPVNLSLGTVGDTMAYDKTELVVPAGSKVTLLLKNGAAAPAMVHNWVLIRKGAADEVGKAAITAGLDQGYIPDNPAIIAHSPLVKPGTSAPFTFDAPPPGTYDYICTVPGHYMTMRGTFIVR